MSEGGFLAVLEKSKTHLRSGNADEEDTIRADLLTTSLLLSPLGSSAEVEAYLTEAKTRADESSIDLQEKERKLLNSIDGLLGNFNTQKKALQDVPEEIEATESALIELCNQLEGKDTTDASSTTFRQSLGKQLHSLRQLYEARDYLSVLAKAEDLATKAIAAEEKDDGTGRSISLLTELNALIKKVEAILSSTSELSGSSTKAQPFILSQRLHAFSQLAAIRRKRLNAALERSGWPPGPVELDSMAKSTQKASENVLMESKMIRIRWKELMHLQRQCEKLRVLPVSSSRFSSRVVEIADYKPKNIPQAGSQAFQPLFACQCLLSPLLLRFYYHFDSTRSTNRLDKPEWYLTHMLNIVRSNVLLFDPVYGSVASLCSNKSSKLPQGYRYNLYAELLHGILRPLVVKLEASMPLLLENSSLLSHTIIQTVQFDQDLRDILPSAEAFPTICLSEILLSNQNIFEAWVQSERDFATERLHQELESGQAWTVGEGEDADVQQDSWAAMMQEGGASAGTSNIEGPLDESGPKMKTTRSAQALVALLEGLTKRYQALPSLTLQLPFLLIQLSLLQGYAQRLDRSLDAFESMSSAFSRSIPGSIAVGGSPGPDISLNSEGDMVKGLRGLGRLLKAALSAIFVTRHLASLSSSIFYLDIGIQMHSDKEGLKALSQFEDWQGSEEERELDKASLGELVRRGWKSSSKVASGLRPLGGRSPQVQTMTLPQTSSVPSVEKAATGHTDVWEDMRARYDQIAARSLKGIEKLVVSEVLEGSRFYAHRDWDEDEEEDEEGEESEQEEYPTTTILPCLSLLSTHLTRLIPSLPKIDSNLVYRNISYAICTALVDRVIIAGGSHRFSERGAFRFYQDVMQGWISVIQDVAKSESNRLGTINTAMGRKPEAPWKYLIDVATLLSIPKKSTTDNKSGDEITLRIAVNAVFNQNDQSRWRAIRKQLNVDDRMDIRLVQDILRRRIDSPR